MEKEVDHVNGSADGQQPDGDPADAMDEQAAAKEKLTSSEKIKFTSINLADGKNGEAKVDIQLIQTSIGMGKEELMKYANEPFWVRLRMFLFILFWVAWVAMLVGAVVIILVAPRCPPAPKLDWYQKTVIYQVDVESFSDSNGDNVGDLAGLKSRLDYFPKINVKALLLSALYMLAPGTNAVLNHTDIDNRYGTMSDMEQLIKDAKAKDIKILLDFIPNHTSDQHEWFKLSVKKEPVFKDFYVWKDRTEAGKIPNNWLNTSGKTAWEWNEERQQYYLHTFGIHEPDLNLRNEAVREKLKEILRFWLMKGVDGFKITAASHLIEDELLKDEPIGTDRKVNVPGYKDLDHAYTVNQNENLDLFSEWQEILGNYSTSSGMKKILLAEVSGDFSSTSHYYGNGTLLYIEFPINTQLTELNEDSTPTDLKNKLTSVITSLKNTTSSWPAWLLGDHNTERLVNRVGPDLLDGIHMVAMLSKGTPITYFGDEIGMTESHKSGKPVFMSWNNSTTLDVNVEAQLLNSKSHLKIFSHTAELRNQPAVNFGLQEYPIITNSTFSMIRVRKGSPGYMVVLNMGMNSTTIDFSGSSPYLPDSARVEIRSYNIDSGPLFDGEHPKIKLSDVPLEPKQSVVLSFVPKFKN